jgi:acyl-CoA thioesterase-2
VPDLWSDLLACLDLNPAPSGDTGGERDSADIAEFAGRNQRLEYHRVFGGQLLAQFIRIAALTCPDKAVKSQHAVFAREGRADEPIRYEASRHHDGRSFASVTVNARQSRGVVATSSICMHAGEDGPELAPALTAYATDLTLIGTALRPIDGVGQRGNGTAFTSAVTLVASYAQEALLRFAS